MANSLVLNYIFFHNFVSANSKGTKTVCKCKRVKLRRGENNPLYSNIAHYITHQTHPDTKADPKRLTQFISCLIGVFFLLIYVYSGSDWDLLWVYSVSAGFGVGVHFSTKVWCRTALSITMLIPNTHVAMYCYFSVCF